MSDKGILKLLKTRKADFLKVLGGEATSFNSSPPELRMKFEVGEEFCHTGGKIIQGGFITVMLDAPMAHLLIALLESKFNPVTLDINVSFLGPSHPGKLNCHAKVLKLGKSIVYLASELYQKERLVATATSTVKLVPVSS